MDLPESYKKFLDNRALTMRPLAVWVHACHAAATEKGWWPFTRADRDCGLYDKDAHVNKWGDFDPFYYIVMERLALIGSECSEAIEEWRRGKPLLYEVETTGDRGLMAPTPKPEGIMVELADVVIRVFDLVHALDPDIDFGAVLAWKMHYNSLRPHRHGNLKG